LENRCSANSQRNRSAVVPGALFGGLHQIQIPNFFGVKKMELKVKIEFTIGVTKISGTKRFHYCRNKYGVEIGWNIIPSRFGILIYFSRPS